MDGDNPRNDCPARHLCEALDVNLGCGSDACPWMPPWIILTPRQARGFIESPPLPEEDDDV